MTIPPSTPTPAPKSNKWLWIILGVVGGIMLLSCLCCGVGYWVFGWGVRTAAQTIEAKTADGTLVETFTGGHASLTKLPDNFPSDIPQYPGATLKLAVSGNDKEEGTEGGMVTFATSAKAGAVSKFYQNKLAGEGWTAAVSNSTPDGGSHTVYSKEDRALQLNIAAGDETTIVMVYGKNKP